MSVGSGLNRKLLVSVFNAQEAREAVLGGGRIIDSEDPRSALGNIKPSHIMDISDAVLNYERSLDVQLSTNIGEDQLLFDRSESGFAIQKSPYEIAGKSAQAAVGVSCAMGTRVHPCNWVKVGVDGMQVDLLTEVLEEVVLTLRRTEQFSHSRVMSVLFAQDIETWRSRRDNHDFIRRVLVGLREFSPAESDVDGAFDLADCAVGTLRDDSGRTLFNATDQVSLGALIQRSALPEGSNHSFVRLNELFPHQVYFPEISSTGSKTAWDVIKSMVDATAEAGADAIMLDTRIQSKVARICLLDTGSDGLFDINQYDISSDVPRRGILTLEDIKFFVDYCHYKGVEANLAGSFQSYQAQQIWLKVPTVDQISTRGGSSGVEQNPYETETAGEDTRQFRVIKRSLVLGQAPPEHGGVLNLPLKATDNPKASSDIKDLVRELKSLRKEQGLPDLDVFSTDKFGMPTPTKRRTSCKLGRLLK